MEGTLAHVILCSKYNRADLRQKKEQTPGVGRLLTLIDGIIIPRPDSHYNTILFSQKSG